MTSSATIRAHSEVAALAVAGRDREAEAAVTDPDGLLIWVHSFSTVRPHQWHLSFDHRVTLCEHSVDAKRSLRLLAEGPPAERCVNCAEVIAWRLGLKGATR